MLNRVHSGTLIFSITLFMVSFLIFSTLIVPILNKNNNEKILIPKLIDSCSKNNSYFDVYSLTKFDQTTYGIDNCDFNNDGNIDFIVSSATSPFEYSKITVFLNLGNLTFISNDIHRFDYSYIDDLNANDYDNDGDIDILYTYSEYVSFKGLPIKVNGSVKMLINMGNNNFQEEKIIVKFGLGSPYNTENRINSHINSADFDNDGDIDFIVGDNSGKVELFLNNANGKFFSDGIINDFGDFSYGISSADLNHDQYKDFLVFASFKNESDHGCIYAKYNNNLPSCFDKGWGILIDEIHNLFCYGVIEIFDFENDNDMDFLICFNNIIYIYIDNGNNYERFDLLVFPINLEGYFESFNQGGISSADLNNDGYNDLILGGALGYIRLLINKSKDK